MENFSKDIIEQFQLMLLGDLNLLHYLILTIGFIILIVGIMQLKNKLTKGIITIISTIFYTFSFYVTANNYATVKSILAFFIISVILNFSMHRVVHHLSYKTCFSWLLGYFLIAVPQFFSESLVKFLNLSESAFYQFCMLLISVLLSIIVPLISKKSASKKSESQTPSDGAFSGYGPGWGSVFKNWH